MERGGSGKKWKWKVVERSGSGSLNKWKRKNWKEVEVESSGKKWNLYHFQMESEQYVLNRKESVLLLFIKFNLIKNLSRC